MDKPNLLTTLDWRSLSEAELQQAARTATKRGRQTAELLKARLEERGDSITDLPLPTVVTYIDHCVKTEKDGEEREEEWLHHSFQQALDDPRVYHFCAAYYDASCRLFHWVRDPLTLAEAQVHATVLGQEFANLQQWYATVRGWYNQATGYRQHQIAVAAQQAYQEMLAALDHYCLAQMIVNATADQLLERI